MSPGPYRRLTGIVRLNGRSPVLEAEDQAIIRLRSQEDLSPFADQTVIVEGNFRGAATLEVSWIARAAS